MKLHIGEYYEHKNATAMIRWCLSPQEIDKIKTEASRQPQAVIIVLTQGGAPYFNIQTESRQIVPLTDMVAYITFRNPGKHTVLVGVLSNEYCDPSNQSRILGIIEHCSGYDEYNHSLINAVRDENPFIRFRSGYLIDPDLWAAMEIPEVEDWRFAPKPKDYEFINYWYSTKPQNQCLMRKRRLESYPKVILCMPFIYSFVLIWNVFFMTFLMGWRHLNWSWFRSPFSNTFKLPKDERYSFWLETGPKQDKTIFRLLINWRSLVMLGVFAYLVIFDLIPGIWAHPIIGSIFVGGIVIISAIVVIINKYGEKWLECLENYEEESEKKRQERLGQELSVLECQLVPKEIGLATLPKDKRTFGLRFRHLKTRVCKPYAGN